MAPWVALVPSERNHQNNRHTLKHKHAQAHAAFSNRSSPVHARMHATQASKHASMQLVNLHAHLPPGSLDAMVAEDTSPDASPLRRTRKRELAAYALGVTPEAASAGGVTLDADARSSQMVRRGRICPHDKGGLRQQCKAMNSRVLGRVVDCVWLWWQLWTLDDRVRVC